MADKLIIHFFVHFGDFFVSLSPNNIIAMKRFFIIAFMAMLAMSAFSQGPNNSREYYKPADGKKGKALKSALHDILTGYYTFYDKEQKREVTKEFSVVSYAGLFDAYEDTDLRDDGKIWDMYSNITNYSISNHTGSYDGEGGAPGTTRSMYNREHSVPASWFNDKTPMYSDLFHVYPTDGYINNMRSNYPFGETSNPTKQSSGGFSKLGNNSVAGAEYKDKVFEPNDIYKGDFARSYFYMVTCYQDSVLNASNGQYVFYGTTADSNGNTIVYPGMKPWALNMFIKWSHNDAVSDKEVKRNNAVSELQFNRNPFIDYPGLEEYIWGSMKDVAFSYDNYVVPEGTSPYDPGNNNDPDNPTNPDDPGSITPTPAEGECVYKRVSSVSELVVGAGYIIVCESENMAMAQNDNDIRKNVSLTTSNGTVTTAVNTSGKPYEVTLGKEGSKYTLYDTTEKVYLAHTAKANKLHTATSASATGAQWEISFSGNDAIIKNPNYDYRLQYNKSAPRFCCYSSNQTPVQLYKRQESTTPVGSISLNDAKPNTVIYDLQGRRLGTTANGMPRLKKGVYVLGKRKMVVK